MCALGVQPGASASRAWRFDCDYIEGIALYVLSYKPRVPVKLRRALICPTHCPVSTRTVGAALSKLQPIWYMGADGCIRKALPPCLFFSCNLLVRCMCARKPTGYKRRRCLGYNSANPMRACTNSQLDALGVFSRQKVRKQKLKRHLRMGSIGAALTRSETYAADGKYRELWLNTYWDAPCHQPHPTLFYFVKPTPV